MLGRDDGEVEGVVWQEIHDGRGHHVLHQGAKHRLAANQLLFERFGVHVWPAERMGWWLLVDVRFQKPGEAMEIAVWLDITDDGDEIFLIDELLKRDEVQLQLPGCRNHDAV